MKRSLVLLAGSLALLACAPANYDQFGISVLQHLSTQQTAENVFISPLSIGVALSMAADGAAGTTRSEIVHALHVPDACVTGANAALIKSLQGSSDAQIGLANALWLRQDIPPRPRYVDLLKRDYGAQVQALQFGDPSAAAAINDWTKQHTLGLIDHFVDQTNPQDFAFLTNALAFKADWQQPFKKGKTAPHPFTDADGTKHNVQMMSQDGQFETMDGPDYDALRMPYGEGGGYAAYILLPPQGKLDSVLTKLDGRTFDTISHSMNRELTRVELPRFTARYDSSLNEALKSLGVGIAFTFGSDFTPMHTGPQRLRIANVQHASYVRVDEQGTTAAAATSVEIGMTAIEMPQKTFTVDHPFILAIRDEKTGTLLFIGAIRTLSG